MAEGAGLVGSEEYVVDRLGRSLQLIADLIGPSDDRSLPLPIQVGCLDAWFTHYRSLIEFLLLKPPANCARASDFNPAWDPKSVPYRARLLEGYGWASEHVSHIGTPKPSAPIHNVAPAMLRFNADLLLDVVEEWAKSTSEHVCHAEIMAVSARAREALNTGSATGTIHAPAVGRP